MHQQTLDYETHCKYYLGQYAQAHDPVEPSNTQAPPTRDVLYLRPTTKGSHDVFDLKTEEIINSQDLTPLPVTESVIHAVEKIAAKNRQKVSASPQLMALHHSTMLGLQEWITM